MLESHNGPFQHSEVPRPIAGLRQVLVRIMASGVNPLDLKIRSGAADHARQPLPAILGIDLAGIVVEIWRSRLRARSVRQFLPQPQQTMLA